MTSISDYNNTFDGPLQEIGSRLATVLDSSLPHAQGTLWHGHPVWKEGATPVAGFKTFPKHVTFMIWQGQTIEDPSGLLSPTGSAAMASVKFAAADEIDEALIAGWLAQLGS